MKFSELKKGDLIKGKRSQSVYLVFENHTFAQWMKVFKFKDKNFREFVYFSDENVEDEYEILFKNEEQK